MIGSVGLSRVTTAVTTVTQSVTTAVGQSRSCSAGKTGDRADISGPGKLFGDLKQLAAQDPAKFKQVAADIAAKLKAAAGSDPTGGTTATSGVSASSFLSQLADKFQTASQTGDVSGLQPPSGGGHHHHGHRTGGVQGTYNQQGQAIPTVAPQAAGGVDLKALFDDIRKEVTDALGAAKAA